MVVAVLGAGVLLARSGEAASSYPFAAEDEAGSSTGASEVALGVPDYRFVNDAGLGFGGTNTDVFDPGEATVLRFPAPIRAIPDQPDLLVSAFVGGTGATDTALVEVAVSTDGSAFTSVALIDTADGRDFSAYPFPENAFASVKHFPVEIGSTDQVTHVRLTNLAGSAEGLRLDAVEALRPSTVAAHAFEIRFERYRGNEVGRFLVRLKNIAQPGGVPIRELRIDKPAGVNLEDTTWSLCEDRSVLTYPLGQCPLATRFLCVENCISDNGPSIPFSRHVWSLDGASEAPPGSGLEPGRQAANLRNENFDTDGTLLTFLGGFGFTVTFTDGFTHSFTYTDDVLSQGTEGALFQKYLYFSSTPSVFGPRPVSYYEFVGEPAACQNGLDDDGDGAADFPDDPGCKSLIASPENPLCDDGVDNDGDGRIDWDGGPAGATPDPQCSGTPWKNQEASPSSPPSSGCGIGPELAGLVFLLRRLRREDR